MSNIKNIYLLCQTNIYIYKCENKYLHGCACQNLVKFLKPK